MLFTPDVGRLNESSSDAMQGDAKTLIVRSLGGLGLVSVADMLRVVMRGGENIKEDQHE